MIQLIETKTIRGNDGRDIISSNSEVHDLDDLIADSGEKYIYVFLAQRFDAILKSIDLEKVKFMSYSTDMVDPISFIIYDDDENGIINEVEVNFEFKFGF